MGGPVLQLQSRQHRARPLQGGNGKGAGKHCDGCDGTICTGLPYPDFVTIASGYGIPGRRVFTREELEPAIEEMLACDGPFLLDVYTGYDEHVLPMIPPGGDYTSIIME